MRVLASAALPSMVGAILYGSVKLVIIETEGATVSLRAGAGVGVGVGVGVMTTVVVEVVSLADAAVVKVFPSFITVFPVGSELLIIK